MPDPLFAEGESVFRLLGRLLAYPELDALISSVARLVRENDGLDAAGNPFGFERDLLSDLLGVASRLLKDMERPTGQAGTATPSPLAKTLLQPIQLRGTRVGGPAWAVRVDKHGNPDVARCAETRAEIAEPIARETVDDADGDAAACAVLAGRVPTRRIEEKLEGACAAIGEPDRGQVTRQDRSANPSERRARDRAGHAETAPHGVENAEVVDLGGEAEGPTDDRLIDHAQRVNIRGEAAHSEGVGRLHVGHRGEIVAVSGLRALAVTPEVQSNYRMVLS